MCSSISVGCLPVMYAIMTLPLNTLRFHLAGLNNGHKVIISHSLTWSDEKRKEVVSRISYEQRSLETLSMFQLPLHITFNCLQTLIRRAHFDIAAFFSYCKPHCALSFVFASSIGALFLLFTKKFFLHWKLMLDDCSTLLLSRSFCFYCCCND